MPRKPQTEEELLQDQAQHPNRGKINGELVADISTIELDIFVPGSLYNKIIQIRGALSYTKSQVAQEAMLAALKHLKALSGNQSIGISLENNGKSNFRGGVPQYIYRRAAEVGALHGLNLSQVGYLGLHLFVHDPQIVDEYEIFLARRQAELSCSREEIVEAIYGLSKALSRKERIKELEKQKIGLPSDVGKPKMSI